MFRLHCYACLAAAVAFVNSDAACKYVLLTDCVLRAGEFEIPQSFREMSLHLNYEIAQILIFLYIKPTYYVALQASPARNPRCRED